MINKDCVHRVNFRQTQSYFCVTPLGTAVLAVGEDAIRVVDTRIRNHLLKAGGVGVVASCITARAVVAVGTATRAIGVVVGVAVVACVVVVIATQQVIDSVAHVVHGVVEVIADSAVSIGTAVTAHVVAASVATTHVITTVVRTAVVGAFGGGRTCAGTRATVLRCASGTRVGCVAVGTATGHQ